jgi:hypothetical protein
MHVALFLLEHRAAVDIGCHKFMLLTKPASAASYVSCAQVHP